MDATIGHNTHRLVRDARRRLLVAAIVESAGRGLAWGAAAGLAAVIVSKFVGVPVPMWMLVGVPLCAGALAGVGIGLSRRKSSLGAATFVDQRLGLKDRIATATSLEAMTGRDGVFVGLAMAEAESASSTADVRLAVPVRFGNAWMVWPTAFAAAILVAVYVPRFDLLGRKNEGAKANESARQRVEAQLASAGKKTEPPAEPETRHVDSKAQVESERVLEEIRKELAAGTMTPQAAAERAAKQLDTLAKDREQAAAASEQRRDSVEQAVGELRKSESDGTSKDQSDLAKALRSGDFAQASQAAKDLLNSEKESGAEGRARTAEEIAKIAEQLRSAAKATEDAKRRSEQSRSAAPKPDQDQTQPGTPSEPGEPQEPKDSPLPDRTTEDLAKSLDRAADALRREAQQEQPPKPDSAKPSSPQETKEPPEQPKGSPPQPQSSDSQKKPDTKKQSDSQKQSGIQKQQSEQSEHKDQAAQQQRNDQPNKADSRPSNTTEKSQPREQRQSGEPKDADSQKRSESREPRESKSKKQSDAADAQPKPNEKAGASKPEQMDQATKPDQAKPDQGSEQKDASKPPSEPTPSDSKPQKSATEKNGEGDNPGGTDSPATPKPDGKPSPSASPNAATDDQHATPHPGPTKSGDSPDKQPSPSSTEQPDSAHPGDQPQPKPGESAADKSPQPTSGTKPSPEQQDPSQPPQPKESASKPDPSSAGKQPDKLPNLSREDIKRLADELQKLADAPKDAAARRQEAQQYRKQAEELLKNASPEQREQIKRWGRDLADEMQKRGHGEGDKSETPGQGAGNRPGDPIARAPDHPRESRTDTVDARTRPSPDAGKPRERVIAEWYSDRPANPADRSTSSDTQPALSSEGQSLAREAAREGERALESQIVPGRFDKLLQRYFQRLPQRAAAKPGDAPDVKPVEPAKDAPGAAAP